MLKLRGFLYFLLVSLLVSCASVDKTSIRSAVVNRAALPEDLGQVTARNLAFRYGDTLTYCTMLYLPAYYCSGVMIRVTGDNPSYHVWENSPASIAKGGVSFSYLRADTRFTKLAFNGTNGYIMNAYQLADGKLQPRVLCMFPLDAWTADRDEHGCGAYPGLSGSQACQSQSITTAQQWWEHYDSHTADRRQNQCGFSVQNIVTPSGANAFKQAIVAMSLVTGEPVATQNEMVMSAWNNGVGAQLPLEAFFYMAGSVNGLRDAKRNQQDLKQTHDILIPVIEVSLPSTPTGVASFVYNSGDQTEPMPTVGTAAKALTERYLDTRQNCGSDSQPAFLCSGVVIRGTASNPTYHVWNNSPASITKGGVSASYLRADSNFSKLAYNYTNGYILQDIYGAKDKYEPQVLCFFPIDSGSANRADKGCGQTGELIGSGPCHLSDVFTAQQWWDHYNKFPDNRHARQCGFAVEDDRNALAGPAFMAGVGGMALMDPSSFAENNEMILATWPDGLGKTLPLEAFFYLTEAGRVDARRNQRDLYDTDGVGVPVIKITLPQSPGEAVSFTYNPADQAVSKLASVP